MRVAIDARKIADFGIGTYIRGLLRGLAEIDESGEYAVLGPASLREQIPARFEHVVVDAPHYSVAELFQIGRAAAAARADVLHAPHYVVPFTSIPVVVTIHDLIHLRVLHANPLAPLYARTMLRRAVRKSTRVLTVTAAASHDIIARLGCAEAKITVTPNGVDALFSAGGPRAERGKPYFLFVGNDKPHKNLERLVEAFGRTRAASSSELLLVGSAFERFRSRAGAVAIGFVSVEELAALYRGAVALIIPSIDEGFGLPALEAMACGTAVIASTATALVEVTADAALHVDARDVEAIAAAIDRVASHEGLRQELAGRGLVRSRAFTWRRCAELTLEAYRAAASSAQ